MTESEISEIIKLLREIRDQLRPHVYLPEGTKLEDFRMAGKIIEACRYCGKPINECLGHVI